MATKANKDVYMFHAAVSEYPEESWRDILIANTATLEDLGRSVLRSFDCLFGHLWCIRCRRQVYEGVEPIILWDEDDAWEDPHPMASSVTLESLALRKGSVLYLAYDYGTTWDFTLRVADRMTRAEAGRPLPRLVEGKGPDMVEDMAPYEVWDLALPQRAGRSIEEEDPNLAEWLGEGWTFDTDPPDPRPL